MKLIILLLVKIKNKAFIIGKKIKLHIIEFLSSCLRLYKKRYKIGNTITIHTSDSSITGTIDSFEDDCIVLNANHGLEYISDELIKRFSVPQLDQDKVTDTALKTVPNQPKSDGTVSQTKVVTTPKEPEQIKPDQEQVKLPDNENKTYKPGDVMPLEILESRMGKTKKSKFNLKPGQTFKNLNELKQYAESMARIRLYHYFNGGRKIKIALYPSCYRACLESHPNKY